MKYWVGNGLVDSVAASISIVDHGLTVGDGVFETLKVTNGVPFAMTRHLQRLGLSAAAMGLPVPDVDAIRRAAEAVIEVNAADVGALARLRITYTGGPGPFGTDRGTAEPTLVITTSPGTVWPESAAIEVVPWTRNERAATAGVKSTSYAENIIALSYAKEHGASEAIFANTKDQLCEGTGTNVFVVVAGEVITPPLTSGCLAGITRGLIIDWFDVTEADLPMDVLGTAEEIFLASSTRDVQAVHRVDDRTVQAPGPVTTWLSLEFTARAEADVDP